MTVEPTQAALRQPPRASLRSAAADRGRQRDVEEHDALERRGRLSLLEQGARWCSKLSTCSMPRCPTSTTSTPRGCRASLPRASTTSTPTPRCHAPRGSASNFHSRVLPCHVARSRCARPKGRAYNSVGGRGAKGRACRRRAPDLEVGPTTASEYSSAKGRVCRRGAPDLKGGPTTAPECNSAQGRAYRRRAPDLKVGPTANVGIQRARKVGPTAARHVGPTFRSGAPCIHTGHPAVAGVACSRTDKWLTIRECL